MEYKNRLPSDGINTPGRHPFKEFLRLSFFAVVALICVGVLLNYAGGQLGGFVPFKAERWVAEKIDTAMIEAGQDSPFEQSIIDTPLEEYLHELGGRVQAALEIEEPMSISLHYSPDNTVNAYATIGGHVYLFNGLLRQLPHENALTMLMAHEFAHVQLRHTAKGIGSGLAVAVGMAVFPGDTTFDSPIYNFANQLSSMRFSRGMETSADEAGLRAVDKIYGHVSGADDLFELFMSQREEAEQKKLDAFFSTHPLDLDRIQFIADYASENDLATHGELTALPDRFKQWLSAPSARLE